MSGEHATGDSAFRSAHYATIVDLVGSDSDVLDVGCGSGRLTEILGNSGCRVSGIEVDATAAERARPFLKDLVVADLDEADLSVLFPPQSFDVIVFGDVLDSVRHPRAVLAAAAPLLRPAGRVIISVRNVGHISVRLAVLQGRWDDAQMGHIGRARKHFFTLDSLRELVAGAGLRATELRGTPADARDNAMSIDVEELPPAVVHWVSQRPGADAYEFVVSARVGDEADDSDLWNLPTTDSGQDSARRELVRMQTEAARLQSTIDRLDAEIVRLRRRDLTHRDFAIGSEAQIGRMRAQLAAARDDTAQVRAELASADNEAAQARAELAFARAELASAHAEIARIHDRHEQFQARLRSHRVRSALAVAIGPRLWAAVSVRAGRAKKG